MTRSLDPIPRAQATILAWWDGPEVVVDGQIGESAGWRPHVWCAEESRAWHLILAPSKSNFWAERIGRSVENYPDLNVVLAGVEDLLFAEEVILAASRLNAELQVLVQEDQDFRVEADPVHLSDWIVDRQLVLSREVSREVLDRSLERTESPETNDEKGALFEDLIAILLSQVRGYRIQRRRVKGPHEEIDLLVENQNLEGSLGRSRLICVECRNRKAKPEPHDVTHFLSKLERHGYVRTGFFFSTSKPTPGFASQIVSERKGERLVVPVTGEQIPALWRDYESITEGIEQAVIDAVNHQFR